MKSLNDGMMLKWKRGGLTATSFLLVTYILQNN